MLTIAYYFLQVVLCSGMMMGYYWLVLRNKRFHQYNRFYLLAAALLSWIVPLIKITWSQPVVISEQPQVMQFLSVVADNNSQIEQTIHTQPVSQWSRELLVTGIYFGVAAILFFGMVQAFTKLYRLLRDHSCKNVGDIYLVLTQAKGTPFSFFRYIFWNEEIDIRSEAGKQILQHELTHVQQKHSFDKLFIQVILIGGWFNPFFWLLRKEMDMIHEFIADKKAVNNGDTAALAQMLLTAAYPQQQFALTHPFFFSPIKRRLLMLTNNKNPRYSYIRRLIVLPLLAIVTVLFAFRSKERRENAEISMTTVMENVAADQKQLFNSFFQGVGNFFEKKNTEENKGFHSIFYNGRPLTVPISFSLKDLSLTMVPHLDKDHLNLVPSLDITNAPDPLYVIDGKKQADKKALDVLNPDDIHMIQVWKNTDAIAKYGDAGKDGVIEITTKAFADKKTGDGFSGLVYEGLVKDPIGNAAKNRVVYLKITIFQGEADKTKAWEETHVVRSNDNGVISFTLGKDVKSSTKPEGEMEKLDWTQGPYFVNLAAAVAPSIQANWWVPQDNYIDHGTTKMMTVPFPVVPKASGYTPRHVSFGWKGKDVTIGPNTTAIATVDYPEAKKGDQVYVMPGENKSSDWVVYSAWVEADGLVKVRFANFTDKQVSVAGSEYGVGIAKFDGLEPNPNWVQKYYDTTNWFNNKWRYAAGLQPLVILNGTVFTGQWNSIEPNNVMSITVLKGETALKKYGEQAKNGVLEITTKSNTGIKSEPANTFLVTDSLGTVKWQTASGIPSPAKKFPDSLVWIKGSQLPAKDRLLNDAAKGTLRARSIPTGRIVEGVMLDNSPAAVELKKRNTDVEMVYWKDKTHFGIQLKDKTNETYDLTKPESKKRAETKYGNLPEVPAVVANAPVRDEVTVMGYGVRNSTKTPSVNLSIPGTISGGTFSGVLSANTYTLTTIPAEFPGGLSAWTKYLERNLDKDVPLKKGAPPGRYTVVLSFDIDEDGTVRNAKALNDPGYGTMEEAARMITNGPKWKPATKDGKNISYTHKQSITFFVSQPLANISPIDPSQRQEYYVFCNSRSTQTDSLVKKQVFLTEIKKYSLNKAEIMEKMNQWRRVVDGVCSNDTKCTADFNTYPTYEFAKKVWDDIKKHYSDINKYSIKIVAFD
jgi:hypothetical protein